MIGKIGNQDSGGPEKLLKETGVIHASIGLG